MLMDGTPIRIKRDDTGADTFENILEEFPLSCDCFKPLCRSIRDILFPYKSGLFVGTPRDSEVLYGPIIKAYEDDS